MAELKIYWDQRVVLRLLDRVLYSMLALTILLIGIFPSESINPTVYSEEKQAHLEPQHVVIGTSGLTDGYRVVSATELEASWRAYTSVKSNGSFSIALELFYLNEQPKMVKFYDADSMMQTQIVEDAMPDLRSITSIIFMQMEAIYKDNLGDLAHLELTKIIPLLATQVYDREAQIYYEGNYEMPPIRAQEELYAISLKISWLRIFQDRNDNWYYQWLQGNKDPLLPSNPIKLDEERWTNGDLLVYYPIPESSTSDVLGFDYVTWIKEQLHSEFEKTFIGLSSFPFQPSLLADSEGSLHLVWSTEQGLMYAKVGANGKALITPKMLTKGYFISDVSTAMYDNRIHIVWSEMWAWSERESPSTYKSGIYYTVVSSDGKVQQAPIRISDEGAYTDIVAGESKAFVVSESGVTGITMTAVPEFPVNLMAITAMALIGALIAYNLVTKSNISHL